MKKENSEIYYIDYGAAKVYYRLLDANTVAVSGGSVTLSREKLLDYLATARVLGHKTGKL